MISFWGNPFFTSKLTVFICYIQLHHFWNKSIQNHSKFSNIIHFTTIHYPLKDQVTFRTQLNSSLKSSEHHNSRFRFVRALFLWTTLGSCNLNEKVNLILRPALYDYYRSKVASPQKRAKKKKETLRATITTAPYSWWWWWGVIKICVFNFITEMSAVMADFEPILGTESVKIKIERVLGSVARFVWLSFLFTNS